MEKLKKSLEKLITTSIVFLLCLWVIDAVVNAKHARAIRVAWRDAKGSQEVPLGSLHRIVAWDPPLGLALLRGLHYWDASRVVSGVWVTSRNFRPSEWARI